AARAGLGPVLAVPDGAGPHAARRVRRRGVALPARHPPVAEPTGVPPQRGRGLPQARQRLGGAARTAPGAVTGAAQGVPARPWRRGSGRRLTQRPGGGAIAPFHAFHEEKTPALPRRRQVGPEFYVWIRTSSERPGRHDAARPSPSPG